MFKAVMLIKAEVMPRERRKGREKEEKTRRNGACVRPRVCSHKSSEACKKKGK